MSKIAFIFPGQGSQYVGMGLDFYNSSETAKKIFNQFNEVLGKNLSGICFEGPEEDLKQTINTQPGILAISIAAYLLLKEKTGIKPDYVAGHSLGEYAALYAAGVVELEDVIKLVQRRSELMSQAQAGSMTAILGMDDEKLAEMLKKASVHGIVTVANYNTPDQTVITGEVKAVEAANQVASEIGAKRVIPLAVSGAFHSPVMKEASDQFADWVANFNIKDATVPVITNVDAKPTTKKEEFSLKMVDQIYSSVYWKQSISYMIEQGVDTFIEIGPGKVLSGMVKKISRPAKVYNVADMATLEEVINTLNIQVTV
ncbi:MAG: [acyl-carrier-protein] S-malonyltransferase [Candidatus Melainabacteria bacterium GWF2_32_7]|nr:MAG: [acyl-carrier-protein] S-malonyltransferase [Candidatus Melainabacteria bacterium GWF2_32_7]